MSHVETFDQLYQRAAERKGGAGKLELLVSKPKSEADLRKTGDDRILAAFTKKVFQSGFVWRVVEDKWPDFEHVFFGFDIDKVLLMPDEMLEKKAQDPSIIRNYTKVKTVRDNALMIDSVRRQHGSFAAFLVDWPNDDIVGLWTYLKKHGARLGGNTGAYGLRAIGKDTFVLSRDVQSYFEQRKVIEGSATSKRSLAAMQSAFNHLVEQSGRSLREISQIIAYSVGDNAVHAPA